jgi:hypothetical protein
MGRRQSASEYGSQGLRPLPGRGDSIDGNGRAVPAQESGSGRGREGRMQVDCKARTDPVPKGSIRCRCWTDALLSATLLGVPTKRIRLLTTAILAEFAQMVYVNRHRLNRLWLVAPWIGDVEGGGSLALLLEATRQRRVSIIVLTRPPDLDWHSRALQALRDTGQATIYTSRTLHTKLYLAECNGFRGAVLGSPNLTNRADTLNLELAVEFRTTVESSTDDVAALVSELATYASDLRGQESFALT